MKKQWIIFLTGIQFLTRIRVPAGVTHDPAYLSESPKYFPVIGWIVGGFCGLAFFLFGRYVSVDVGVLASMITGFLVTGAFHEDGFADVCDGFGGGWTKEKILLIMKDSRIGAYGAIGLISILGSKFVLLRELAGFRNFIPLLLAAHSVSRLMPVLVMQWSVYSSDPNDNKSKDITARRLPSGSLILAVLLALAPFVFFSWHFLLVILPAVLATFLLNRYFRRWIGGYTGDCLGAIQQVTELVIYLGFLLIWRYF
ncbi:MAG: adenosylcobinamide-GDP ribazoletransferase [Bacteroidetes bacterium]|nr:adenosylcobinamide-GDP ribazoletransferase [Bacteroidota bacterium]